MGSRKWWGLVASLVLVSACYGAMTAKAKAELQAKLDKMSEPALLKLQAQLKAKLAREVAGLTQAQLNKMSTPELLRYEAHLPVCVYPLHANLSQRNAYSRCELLRTKVHAPITFRDHCGNPKVIAFEYSQIPHILGLRKGAAHILHIYPLRNRSWMMYGSVIGHKGLSGVITMTCPIRVTWSNGLSEDAYISRWRNRYGQAMVSFGRRLSSTKIAISQDQ